MRDLKPGACDRPGQSAGFAKDISRGSLNEEAKCRGMITEGRSIGSGQQTSRLELRIVLSAADPSEGHEAGSYVGCTHIIYTEQGATTESSSVPVVTSWSRFWRDLADSCLNIEELGAGRLATFVKGLKDASNA